MWNVEFLAKHLGHYDAAAASSLSFLGVATFQTPRGNIISF